MQRDRFAESVLRRPYGAEVDFLRAFPGLRPPRRTCPELTSCAPYGSLGSRSMISFSLR